MILKINLSNQLYVLRKHLKGGLLMFLILPFFKFQKAVVIALALLYLFFSLPVIYLHLLYYIVSRNREIIIDEEGIAVKKKNKIIAFKKSDLNNIVYCNQNISLFNAWNPLDVSVNPYNYVRIITNCGQSIIITSLMCRNLDDVINKFRNITVRRIDHPYFRLKKVFLVA